ncbi:MAG: hypothetical protein ACREIM_08020 [Nitrospiraceae bacterium]
MSRDPINSLRLYIYPSLLFLILLVAPTEYVLAQDNHWGFGTDIGVWTGTTDDSVFAMGLGLDYYMDPNFSFGGLVLFTPVGDLTQVAAAGVAKYHLRFNNGVNLVPFAGLGLIHADLDRGREPNRIDRNDTSHFIPLGLSLEYQVGPTIAFSSTVMVNLHHITLSPPVQDDSTSVALLFGIRWGP